MKRVYNFNAGPSPMPLSVLEEIKEEFTDYRNTGMSVIEMSHRSQDIQSLMEETEALTLKLMGLSHGYHALFIQGGGSLQFIMEAMNFLHTRAAFADTGVWAQKARAAAACFGEVYNCNSAGDRNYTYIPDTVAMKEGTDFLHITTNNTIYGTEYPALPDADVPLICDMSSNILSRPMEYDKCALIWAGIQKNLGAAGMALAVIRDDFAETARSDIPPFLQYKTFIDKASAYNTPPVFCIYTLNKMLHWIEKEGGIPAMEGRNKKKVSLLYDVIDESGGFYRGHAEKPFRSRMNVTFTLPTKEMEKDFIQKARENGLIGTGGHRLVGGCRISLYNAVTVEAAQAAADFMKEYQRQQNLI